MQELTVEQFDQILSCEGDKKDAWDKMTAESLKLLTPFLPFSYVRKSDFVDKLAAM